MTAGLKPFIKERNVIRKDNTQDKLKFALFFPNHYQTAMGGLTVKYLYHLVNSREDCYCERVFLPFNPNCEPSSLEKGRSLAKFDILGVTTQFELDYMTLGWSLRKAGIPYSNMQRKKGKQPLIVAGGPCCTVNIFPLLDITDGYFFGDAEKSLSEFLNVLEGEKGNFFRKMDDLREIPGFWSPHFLDVKHEDESGFSFSALFINRSFDEIVPEKINLEIIDNLDETPYPTSQVIHELPKWHPYAPFCGESYLLEVGRGCPHNCRFCMIGHLFRPSRYRSISKLLELAEEGAKKTGVKRINLFGSNLSNHPSLTDLVWELVNSGYEISLATFRADKVEPEVVEAAVKGGQSSVTIAPEVGSNRLRRVINKQFSNEQVIEATRILYSHPEITTVKLFFLTGIPTEAAVDRVQMVNLIKKIRNQAGKDQLTRVNVNPLIPKWQTPFMAWVINWLPGNRESLKTNLLEIWEKCKKIEKVRPTFISFRKAMYQTWITHTRTSLIPLVETIPEGSYPVAQSYKAFASFKKNHDQELEAIWKQFSKKKEIIHPFSCGSLNDEFYTGAFKRLIKS
ncbi:MAG: radical SAM protein [Candidatus Hodarchaeales archaeon]